MNHQEEFGFSESEETTRVRHTEVNKISFVKQLQQDIDR